MTFEELAAAGLSPNRDEAHESEDIHVRESDLDNASAHDSETHEEGGGSHQKVKILKMLKLTSKILLQLNDQNPCLPRLFLVNPRSLQI
jgi:hypothetical protein